MAKRTSGTASARRRRHTTRRRRSTAAQAKHNATRAFHNRIAVVFDWDETLGPNSFDFLLESFDVDPARFRKRRVQPLADSGWDVTLAEMYCLIAASRSRDARLTRDHFKRVGRQLQTYKGVPRMFDAIRRQARRIARGIEVEFYLLTCGFLDLHRHAPIAKEFSAMWGSEFYFNESDEIEFAKQVITFQEKTLYLMALAKGLPAAGPNEPEDVYRHVAEEDMHVPFDQIIYVNDGASDMPTFALMHSHGGLAVASPSLAVSEATGAATSTSGMNARCRTWRLRIFARGRSCCVPSCCAWRALPRRLNSGGSGAASDCRRSRIL